MGWCVYLISCTVWYALYHLLCALVSPHSSAEWNCRVVTMIHAVWATVACFVSAFILGPFPITQPGGSNNMIEDFIISSSLAYFTFDIIWCVVHNTEGIVMLFHHAVSIAGMLLSLALGVSGTDVIGTIGGSEVTNPLLQIRWFMRNSAAHLAHPKLYDNIQITFIIMFGVVRCGVGSIFFLSHVTSTRVRLIFKLCGVAMYVISWVFYIQILAYARRRYFTRRSLNAGTATSAVDNKHNGYVVTNCHTNNIPEHSS